jgi:hypothetical protein
LGGKEDVLTGSFTCVKGDGSGYSLGMAASIGMKEGKDYLLAMFLVDR